MEFLHSHTNVTSSRDFDDPHYRRHQSLRARLRHDAGHRAHLPRSRPTEDREWFPDIAGSGDPYGVLRDIWANYRDESFISQFLSPALIREWQLFHIVDDADEPELRVEAIHDERGYRRMRRALAARNTTWPGATPTSRWSTWISPATAGSILHHNVVEPRAARRGRCRPRDAAPRRPLGLRRRAEGNRRGRRAWC